MAHRMMSFAATATLDLHGIGLLGYPGTNKEELLELEVGRYAREEKRTDYG